MSSKDVLPSQTLLEGLLCLVEGLTLDDLRTLLNTAVEDKLKAVPNEEAAAEVVAEPAAAEPVPVNVANVPTAARRASPSKMRTNFNGFGNRADMMKAVWAEKRVRLFLRSYCSCHTSYVLFTTGQIHNLMLSLALHFINAGGGSKEGAGEGCKGC